MVPGTTAIPLGDMDLRHEDKWKPLLLHTKIFLEESQSTSGSPVWLIMDLVESAT